MQQQDYLLASLKRVDEDLARQRAIAILKIGVARMMTIQQILASIPEDECAELEHFFRTVPAEVIYDWATEHEDEDEDKRSSGPKPESVSFDLAMVRLIAASGERGCPAGDLQADMGCTRGKIRVALERTKGQGWIRQEGDRAVARYHATDIGLARIK